MLELLREYFQSGWLYWSIVVAYSLTVLSIVGIIISENRNPLKSLAWITVLILFPLGGLILYIFFGRSIKNTRMISRRNKRRLKSAEATPKPSPKPMRLSAENRQHVALARALTGAVLYEGNSIDVITDGGEKIETLLRDIDNARSYVHIQYYIIDSDTTGNRLADALIRAAQRGVKVRVIYDDIGSIHVKRRFHRRMKEAGVEILPFFRVAFPPFATRINWRNHRKVTVIDGTVGYIGGMNIADRYIDGGKRFKRWRDTHLRVTGPAVAALQYSFAVDWNFMGQPLLEEVAGVEPPQPSGAAVQMVTSGPTSRWSNVALIMLKAIANAKKRVFIQTPYFLPTESLLRVLQAAALSKVDVRVMMPMRSDSAILTSASRSYVQECIRAGIKIYLYEGGMLHSKMMIVDDDFSTVGSTNFDFRSFEHNFEGNFFIYSREINARLRSDFIADQELSHRVNASEWRSRPWWHKTRESIVRLLAPIL